MEDSAGSQGHNTLTATDSLALWCKPVIDFSPPDECDDENQFSYEDIHYMVRNQPHHENLNSG